MLTSPSPVCIRAGAELIEGDLVVPPRAAGLVVFAHGSGSSRFSRRNRLVAQTLEDSGFATLLMDLLTRSEEAIDLRTREYRFDIPRLGHRVVAALDWAAGEPATSALPVACFGASTGAAAALIAAAERPDQVRAVISRGGRPDLAADALPLVAAPTLFIVGGNDQAVIEMNRSAMYRMRATVQLEIIPGRPTCSRNRDRSNASLGLPCSGAGSTCASDREITPETLPAASTEARWPPRVGDVRTEETREP